MQIIQIYYKISFLLKIVLLMIMLILRFILRLTAKRSSIEATQGNQGLVYHLTEQKPLVSYLLQEVVKEEIDQIRLKQEVQLKVEDF